MPAEIERRVSPDLFPPPGYSHAVVSPPGSVVWTAGGVPLDASGELVGAGDVRAQAAQILANLTTALAAGGATPAGAGGGRRDPVGRGADDGVRRVDGPRRPRRGVGGRAGVAVRARGVDVAG